MSTTEIRCLQDSTNLLGTVLHLNDLVGTFAGREVSVASEWTPRTVLALATRVAVTAALIFLEFGLLFLYSPLLTGVLLTGMFFYPVPEQTVPIPRLPASCPPPRVVTATHQRTEPHSPVRHTASRIPSEPSSPVSQTGYRTPISHTPDAHAEERARRLQRRSQLLNDSLSLSGVGSGIFQGFSTDLTQSSLEASTSDRSDELSPSNSLILSSSLPSVGHGTTSSLLTNPTVEQGPRSSQVNTTQTTTTQTLSLPTVPTCTVSPTDQLFAIIDQALGDDDDDLSHFFIQHLLPDNITDVEFDGATQRFTIHLSAAREATIPEVGPHAISKVLGATLKIKRTVTGSLNVQGRSLTFDGDALQLHSTVMMVPTTLTLTGLRRNFSGTISLTGTHWLKSGDLIGTYQQFVDTFSQVTWKPL